jgi:fructose-1,6-bisphosphatase/inositol monophosphatase family enzyme
MKDPAAPRRSSLAAGPCGGADPARHQAGLRPAGDAAGVRAAAEVLAVPPAVLGAALLDPWQRVLVGPGRALLLRRQWALDGVPEVLVVLGPEAAVDAPEVRGTAVGWGCERVRHEAGGRTAAVPPPPEDAPLATRFLHLAALAASRVEAAVALATGEGRDELKPDGSPVLGADEAAHLAAARVLRGLGVTVLSEERADRDVGPDAPWVVLDPLDGTGNFRAGLPPWAFSAALVQRGRPLAGVVADLSSGRRWVAAAGRGARRDGRPVRPRPGTTLVAPTAPPGGAVAVPASLRRVRVTGCTAVDVCLVGDGSAAAWHNLDRSGTHVHDVAGGLAVLAAAGGVAVTADGRDLLLEPHTEQLIRFVAAGTREQAAALVAAVR